MENNFLLSIIVPTKNREFYASHTVSQILSLQDDRVQVIVQDNSDTTKLFDMLKKYHEDKRLKYNYSSEVLSFVDNFNHAVESADGEYVCIIGDDDAILPQIIKVVEWAKDSGVEAIKPSLNAVYFWPDSKALKEKVDDGNIFIYGMDISAQKCNPRQEVQKLMNQGAQRYLSLDLVKLYHGIVKRDKLEEVKNRTGKYFGGLSPDIYISVALSLVVNKMVKIDFPLTISGICNKSGSSDSATGKHTGYLEDAPHFRGHDSYEWSSLTPRFYSVDTIWADSALAALVDLREFKLLKEFNLEYLTLALSLKYSKFRKEIFSNYGSNIDPKKILINILLSFKIFFVRASKFLVRKLKKKNSFYYEKSNVENILFAEQLFQSLLLKRGIEDKMVLDNLNVLLNKK